MREQKQPRGSHRAVAACEAGGAVGAAEVQRFAAALPPHRARAQHVGAAERILDELVRSVGPRQSGPPPAEHRREQNETHDERGDEQESAHPTIPGRGVWRASGGSLGPDRSGRSRWAPAPSVRGRRRCLSPRRASESPPPRRGGLRGLERNLDGAHELAHQAIHMRIGRHVPYDSTGIIAAQGGFHDRCVALLGLDAAPPLG